MAVVGRLAYVYFCGVLWFSFFGLFSGSLIFSFVMSLIFLFFLVFSSCLVILFVDWSGFSVSVKFGFTVLLVSWWLVWLLLIYGLFWR